MSSNSESKALAGGLIAVSAVALIALSPAFNKVEQMIKDANAPDTSQYVPTPEDQLGMDGYRLLESKGYGTLGKGFYPHITREQTFFKDQQNPWAGVTMIFNTTEPGTLAFEKVMVKCSPTNPSNPGPSQICSIKA